MTPSAPEQPTLRWFHKIVDPRYRRLHIGIIAFALIVHLATHYATFVPALRPILRDLPYFTLHPLHEAEFLLIIAYAGIVLGLRAGLITVAITAVTSVPFVLTPYVFGYDPRPGEIRDLTIQVVAILVIGVIITVLYDRERRRREAEALAQRLRAVDQVRSSFVSMAAHELRTPLTAILGYSELMLATEALPEQRRAWTSSIRTESERLMDLIDGLLRSAPAQAGTLQVKQERLDLRRTVDDAIGSLGGPPPGHAFRVDVPDTLPPLVADHDKVVQVLVNLLSNAVKYSPAGGDVRVGARPSDDGCVRVDVADQGLGIPSEDQPNLFSSFYRVQRPETDGIPGSGLGLYIVKTLVETMGGRVWLESTPGEGSTFTFTLPVDRTVQA